MLSRLNCFKLHDYVSHVNLQRNNIFRSGARFDSVDLFKMTQSLSKSWYKHETFWFIPKTLLFNYKQAKKTPSPLQVLKKTQKDNYVFIITSIICRAGVFKGVKSVAIPEDAVLSRHISSV